MSFALIFLVIALVLFGIAAFGVASGRINLVAAGLFFLTLAQVFPSLR